MNQFKRARIIAETLGTYRAARYLRARGWPLDAALNALIHSEEARHANAKRNRRLYPDA